MLHRFLSGSTLGLWTPYVHLGIIYLTLLFPTCDEQSMSLSPIVYKSVYLYHGMYRLSSNSLAKGPGS